MNNYQGHSIFNLSSVNKIQTDRIKLYMRTLQIGAWMQGIKIQVTVKKN